MEYLQFLLGAISRHFETVKPVSVAPKESPLRNDEQVVNPYLFTPRKPKGQKSPSTQQGVKRYCGQSQKSVRNLHKSRKGKK